MLLDLLEEFSPIAGVTGSFVFEYKKGVIVSNVPSFIREKRLLKAGELLMRTFASGRYLKKNIDKMTFNYSNFFIFAVELKPKTYLIILADSDKSVNLLNMSINMVKDEMIDFLNQSESAKPAPKQAASNVTKYTIPLKDRIDDSQYKGDLEKVKRALTLTIGPFGNSTFIEVLKSLNQEDVDNAIIGKVTEKLKSKLANKNLIIKFDNNLQRL